MLTKMLLKWNNFGRKTLISVGTPLLRLINWLGKVFFFLSFHWNQHTSWTNRLWASAFWGTVGYSVLPCRLKVEICKTKKDFIPQEKQSRQITTNRPQHTVNTVKVKLKQNLGGISQSGHLFPVLQFVVSAGHSCSGCSFKYYSVLGNKLMTFCGFKEAVCEGGRMLVHTIQPQDPWTRPESGSLPLHCSVTGRVIRASAPRMLLVKL